MPKISEELCNIIYPKQSQHSLHSHCVPLVLQIKEGLGTVQKQSKTADKRLKNHGRHQRKIARIFEVLCKHNLPKIEPVFINSYTH